MTKDPMIQDQMNREQTIQVQTGQAQIHLIKNQVTNQAKVKNLENHQVKAWQANNLPLQVKNQTKTLALFKTQKKLRLMMTSSKMKANVCLTQQA